MESDHHLIKSQVLVGIESTAEILQEHIREGLYLFLQYTYGRFRAMKHAVKQSLKSWPSKHLAVPQFVARQLRRGPAEADRSRPINSYLYHSS
ncbi:hypothetical protein PoB_000311900 [Plakobranchus ocellatus]|uniref:Uncharacterized protein n=1 Tax=Plakobranchus ocellatus TaxID=259542 RepID=A0AAV3Y3F3_9GAST|nr:hypothetical protein PoB_000311900 [Plakobranchus ocellatus]